MYPVALLVIFSRLSISALSYVMLHKRCISWNIACCADRGMHITYSHLNICIYTLRTQYAVRGNNLFDLSHFRHVTSPWLRSRWYFSRYSCPRVGRYKPNAVLIGATNQRLALRCTVYTNAFAGELRRRHLLIDIRNLSRWLQNVGHLIESFDFINANNAIRRNLFAPLRFVLTGSRYKSWL